MNKVYVGAMLGAGLMAGHSYGAIGREAMQRIEMERKEYEAAKKSAEEECRKANQQASEDLQVLNDLNDRRKVAYQIYVSCSEVYENLSDNLTLPLNIREQAVDAYKAAREHHRQSEEEFYLALKAYHQLSESRNLACRKFYEFIGAVAASNAE